MARLDEMVARLDGLLEPRAFADYCPNGLQVPGPVEVERVVTGVSAGAELFERARDAGAGLVIVHHGLFWGPGPQAIDPITLGRLRLLIEAGMALAAYHLPLDGHPEVGNNALLAEAVGAGRREPLVVPSGPERVGRVGFVSGGGSSFLPQAIAAGLDMFVTGEPAERVMNQAAEGQINFVAAGHYATETFGVRRLGEMLAGEFGVAHEFIDLPNPV